MIDTDNAKNTTTLESYVLHAEQNKPQPNKLTRLVFYEHTNAASLKMQYFANLTISEPQWNHQFTNNAVNVCRRCPQLR